jgi:hypothetical protein
MCAIDRVIISSFEAFLKVKLAALNALLDVVIVCCWDWSETNRTRLRVSQAIDIIVLDRLHDVILNSLWRFASIS